jgi:hypothetical protein
MKRERKISRKEIAIESGNAAGLNDEINALTGGCGMTHRLCFAPNRSLTS